MPVRRVELSSIEAKRYSKPHERLGQVRIDHNSSVTLVKEVNPDEAMIEFRYTASYGTIGHIRIEGVMAYGCEAAQFEEQWRKTQQMAPQVASEIHSAVMRVCVPEAVGIAKNLQLPPPIPLPQVQFQQQGQQGATKSVPGPEIM